MSRTVTLLDVKDFSSSDKRRLQCFPLLARSSRRVLNMMVPTLLLVAFFFLSLPIDVRVF